jgi:putative ABC transport system ATP-binding protein
LNLIGCIDTPTSGKIFINDQDVSGRTLGPARRPAQHGRSASSSRPSTCCRYLSAAENVEYPLAPPPGSLGAPSVNEASRLTFWILSACRNLQDHRPNQLSGGQRQRVGDCPGAGDSAVDRPGGRADGQS